MYFDSMVLRQLNGIDDMMVCLTMCLDSIGGGDSRSEMPHIREYISGLCTSIKQIWEKVSNVTNVFLEINSPDGLWT